MSKKEEYEKFTDNDKFDQLDTLHDIRFLLGIIAGLMVAGAVTGIIAFLSYFLR